jgi:hypothetical protein
MLAQCYSHNVDQEAILCVNQHVLGLRRVWFSFRTSFVSERCYRTLVQYLAFIVIDKPPLTVTSIIW